MVNNTDDNNYDELGKLEYLRRIDDDEFLTGYFENNKMVNNIQIIVKFIAGIF